ncbi:MAG: hypothetical protein ACKVY0_29055 [Prosthecobacter sp.]|uniref:hypothetical protein n=1 Tax=Prosthecobacter sp. TaxID=1965333 RepID=UPI0038FFF559
MSTMQIAYILLSLASLLLLTQCTTVGKPMRHDPEKPLPGAKDGAKPAAMDAWYVESKATAGGKPYSCSFVEFDGRGDFIDFKQYRAAWGKVRDLGEKDRLLLVQYCHGWKNNSQSGDVVEFNSFLRLLANSPDIQRQGFRVHGVYLAWRGNVFKPAVNLQSEYARNLRADFGDQDIVNPKHHRRLPLFTWVGEQLSYWGRKKAAEADVAGAPLARAVFACANVAKKRSEQNRVFVMGHSMGALLLEKSVGQAIVGQLAAEYPWFDKAAVSKVNPTPFDLMLFVNSAAPSTHSKQLGDVLWGHRQALKKMNPVPSHADAPLIMSVTSEADSATGKIHPLGNLLAGLSPSLQRRHTDVLTDGSRDEKNREIPSGSLHQSYYYRRTPGHNPLLVDHWVVPELAPSRATPCDTCAGVLQDNLRLDEGLGDAELFFTTPKNAQSGVKAWRVAEEVPSHAKKDWERVKGLLPLDRQSNYWTIRCPKELIGGHNDIWSAQAMEMYAALYRLAVWQSRH